MTIELQEAIERGNLQAVIATLDDGADIESPDIHGYSGFPLRLACYHGHMAIVVELLKRGADIQAANSEGAGAPIRVAARGMHDEIVSLLVQFGAAAPPKAEPEVSTDTNDRRKRRDRRIFNFGPETGKPERRHFRERRVVSVRDLELSCVEWEAYFHSSAASQAATVHHDETGEVASQVFERARD